MYCNWQVTYWIIWYIIVFNTNLFILYTLTRTLKTVSIQSIYHLKRFVKHLYQFQIFFFKMCTLTKILYVVISLCQKINPNFQKLFYSSNKMVEMTMFSHPASMSLEYSQCPDFLVYLGIFIRFCLNMLVHYAIVKTLINQSYFSTVVIDVLP